MNPRERWLHFRCRDGERRKALYPRTAAILSHVTDEALRDWLSSAQLVEGQGTMLEPSELTTEQREILAALGRSGGIASPRTVALAIGLPPESIADDVCGLPPGWVRSSVPDGVTPVDGKLYLTLAAQRALNS